MRHDDYIYVITGQTATGKTRLALELAEKIGGEVVNFDSRQLYKKLDIITGKDIQGRYHNITKYLNQFDIGFYKKNNIKIWLYDIVSPNIYFSPFDYKKCADYVIQNVQNRNKTPIFVGGSYLYIHNYIYNVNNNHISQDATLRKKLNTYNINELQNILKNKDKNLFEKLNNSDKHNPQRLIRKIEILTHSKTKLNNDNLYNFKTNKKIKIIGLKFNKKDELIKSIKKRVALRIKEGAIEEVENLLQQGFKENDCGMNTIGYKQIINYYKKNTSLEEAIATWENKEIQYAKRQLTFMKKNPYIEWRNI